MSVEIAQPFRFEAGRIASVTDPTQQVEKHIWALVSTRLGERVMLPGFGCSAWDQIFESAEPVEAILQTELSAALAAFEPRGRVFSVNIITSADQGLGTGLDVRVTFSLTGFEDVQQVVVTLGPDQQRQPSGSSAVRSL